METKNIQAATKLIDQDFIASVKEDLYSIILTNDTRRALDLLRALEKALQKNKVEVEQITEIRNFYKKIIIKLKFVALPLIGEGEVVELIKKYFTWQFRIAYYDFLDKFKQKLTNIEVYEDRDKLKDEIKTALFNNDLIITNQTPLKKISEWLKDYNSKLGLEVADNLKRTQYFIDLRKIKELDNHDRKKLKLLFDFYEKLKLSSLSPQGFEEDIPIVIDGKFYIFKQGELEVVGAEAQKARTVIGPPKTEAEKKIEEIQKKEKGYEEGSMERKVLEEEKTKEKEIEDLQYMVNKYSEGSLERKVVEEEIEKMNKES